MSAPQCETCPAPVVRRKGSRGRLPKRCESCRPQAVRKPAAKKPASPRPARTPPRGEVGQALAVELAAMPGQVQASTEAAAARALAVQVDQGLSMTSATRELTRVMALLRKMTGEQAPPAPRAAGPSAAGEVPKGVTDLAARAAERRRAAAG